MSPDSTYNFIIFFMFAVTITALLKILIDFVA